MSGIHICATAPKLLGFGLPIAFVTIFLKLAAQHWIISTLSWFGLGYFIGVADKEDSKRSSLKCQTISQFLNTWLIGFEGIALFAFGLYIPFLYALETL